MREWDISTSNNVGDFTIVSVLLRTICGCIYVYSWGKQFFVCDPSLDQDLDKRLFILDAYFYTVVVNSSYYP